jgi:hypothetical protein
MLIIPEDTEYEIIDISQLPPEILEILNNNSVFNKCSKVQ